jgi:mycothiol synthase
MGNVSAVQLTWRNGLDEDETAEVVGLLGEAERADGVAPAGEQVLLRLKAHRQLAEQIEPVQADVRSEHFVARGSDGGLVGYAHLDTEHEASGLLTAELAVHPQHRRRGVGAEIVAALLERAELPTEPTGEDTGRLRIWSHGEHPGALRLAAKFGLDRTRELWRMGRGLPGSAQNPEFSGVEPGEQENALPEVELPKGVSIRALRVGEDEPAVVEVNHRAFSWHPEQGGMDQDELRAKQREDWFDPAGFLLAVDEREEVLGFHWTKVHPDRTGEVYVIGVDPLRQGGGLGRALTVAGLQHLREVGCPRVMLYVEGDNAAAVRVYERLGFRRWDTDVQFGR